MKCPCCDQDVVVDRVLVWLKQNTISFRDETRQLSARQAELAKVLADRMPRPVRRGDLITLVWPDPPACVDQAVKVHIHKLRARLPSGLKIISVHGFGYAMEIDDEREADAA